ncbi:plant UBX domain-containing protein 11 isoform X1 [Cucurbita maxima]|uniref:Plant UBX domain-containing protein 11 isoform X1 n=1 Tax=Cucurbita maxima TaxID=3661 RepID=A0A6J1KXW4_CUCMA|nr:plant UBX domain-containing protein 11 isoform X1 [Cucurbita maxima]
MEQSISSLAFKGSVAEAIVESKNQRKLFVVYISGDDAESSSLESSTWTSSRVAESVSKYCVLLHIPAGSSDAAQFSSIYPQKSVPCITAVGYNGIQLWQNEGFVGAEVLASNLEKAWLGLHIQETTASVLTAALASKKSEASTSRPSDSGSSSLAAVSPADHHIDSSETNLGVNSCVAEEEEGTENSSKKRKEPEKRVKQEDIKSDVKEYTVHHSVSVGNNNESPDPSENNKGSLADPGGQKNCSSENTSTIVHDSPIIPNHIESCQSGASRPIPPETKEVAQQEKNKIVDENNAIENGSAPKNYTSSDIHLNIRLLNGVNLQEKFSKTSTLRMVKDYVDNSQESTFGSYDLAVPYPRKVFTDQDLEKSLSYLGLSNRQSLIMVRHLGVTRDFRGASSSADQRNSAANGVSSDENGDGYFAFVRRILSYVNPFSYLGGTRHETQGDVRQYSSEFSEVERRHVPQPNQGTATTNGNNTRGKQPLSRARFGANIHSIHTLKNDEDDERFKGRNSFWNGNSTEYGGDDGGSK